MAYGCGASFIELVGVSGESFGSLARLDDIRPGAPFVILHAGGYVAVAAGRENVVSGDSGADEIVDRLSPERFPDVSAPILLAASAGEDQRASVVHVFREAVDKVLVQ